MDTIKWFGSPLSLIVFFRLLMQCTTSTLSNNSDYDRKATDLLSTLIKTAFINDSILLALDHRAKAVLNINKVLKDNVRHRRPTIVIISTDSPMDFFQTSPTSFIRGDQVTAMIIFSKSPKEFLNSLDHRWQPENMILLNLNPMLNADHLLEHDTVQRSPKIALIEEGVRNNTMKFFIYTAKPYRILAEWKVRKQLIRTLEARENSYKKTDLLPERYKSFDGAKLYLGSWCDDFPFLYPVGTECKGTSLELLDIIAENLNFTYDVQMETADHNWGSKENGTWTGMLGDLVFNNKDLVVNYFLLTEERNADFDTTNTYYAEGFGFALKVPPPMPKWPGLLYPFTGNMWVTTICTVLMIALLLSISLHVLPESQEPNQAFLLILGGILSQSVHHKLENSWSRLWVGWWWLSALIITYAYTSNLIAFLSVPVFPTRIETVDELAASGLRVCMQDYGNFLPEALKISTDASLYKLGHNLDLFPYAYLSYGIGLGWVMNDTHALVDTYSYLVHVVDIFNHTEDTYLMKENVYPGYLSWFLRKNCPFTGVISNALNRLVEAGLVDHLYMKHMISSLRSKSTHNRNHVSRGQPLHMEHLQGAFMLWGLGLGGACTVLAFEYLKSFLCTT